VTVAVTASGEARDTAYEELVGDAVTQFNDRVEPGLASEIEFVMTDDTDAADVVLSMQPTIPTCDGEQATGTFYWCGPSYDRPNTVDEQVVIPVTSRYTDEATTTLMTAALTWTMEDDEIESLSGLDYDDDRQYEAADPWPGTNELTVAVTTPEDSDRTFTPLVRDTLEYWEAADSEYGDYDASFALTNDTDRADIVVEFVPAVPSCGDVVGGETLGCASILNTRVANTTEYVQIKTGYTDQSTLRTLKHEFGHLYGLTHGEPPDAIMSATYDATYISQPDATTRENPFDDDVFYVYTNYSTFDAADSEVREQVRNTIDYYAAGADGNAPDVTFVLTENRTKADIIIQNSPEGELPCDIKAGSCHSVFGIDTDEDDALETYTTQYIDMGGLEVERVGYHVGRQLSFAFPTHDVPPPFHEDADRTDWFK